MSDKELAGDRLAFHDLLLEHSEDAIVGVDPGWLITVWNKAAERMYGWSAGEVLGRHVPSFVRMNLNEDERAEARREVAERGRWRGEARVERKDGSMVSVEVVNVAVRDSRGEVTGFLGIHRDVSERKRADEALREEQRRCETILESISDSFFALDREWRYTYVNDRALDRLRTAMAAELTREDVLGQNCWEFIPGAVGTAFDRELHRALREQTTVNFEAYSAATDTWTEVNAYPSEDGLSVYARDASERKRGEDEREQRVRQQALVADLGVRALATDDLTSLLDEAVGLVAGTLDVGLAGVAELPAGSEAVILRAGTGWREGVVGSVIERGGRDSQVGYTLLRGEPVVSEDQAADTRFKPSKLAQAHGVVSALSVMIASSDEPFGVLGALSTSRRTFSASDVSFVQAVANVLGSAVERSRAQERLDEAREAERSRIARDLHDDALQELTDALIQADRGRHAGLAPDAADRLISSLQRVSEQLRGAIYDLRPTDDSRPFLDGLRALVDVQRTMAVGCEIDLDIARETPSGVLGSRGTEVLRIVGEALTNARRHSGAHHVSVTARDSGEGGLCVEVADDGRGFDPASEPSRTDGSGIQGMRERAAIVGGDLDIRSTPGAGTTVRIALGGAQDHARARGTARILVVEDHTVVRQAIAAMFEQEQDLEVVAQAGSLAEARGLLQDVDVAVLDLGLPDGRGDDLIPELRDVNPRAQALVLSASLDPEDIARAIDKGAAAAIDKTAGLNELVDAVRRLHGGAAPRS